MMPILKRILSEVSHILETSSFFTFRTALPVYNDLSHQCQRYHNFKYFGHHIEILWGKSLVCKLFNMPGNDTDPDRPNPDLQPLDADLDPDPDPGKCCGSDLSASGFITLLYSVFLPPAG